MLQTHTSSTCGLPQTVLVPSMRPATEPGSTSVLQLHTTFQEKHWGKLGLLFRISHLLDLHAASGHYSLLANTMALWPLKVGVSLVGDNDSRGSRSQRKRALMQNNKSMFALPYKTNLHITCKTIKTSLSHITYCCWVVTYVQVLCASYFLCCSLMPRPQHQWSGNEAISTGDTWWGTA